MSKLQLPSVTLCIIDCVNAQRAVKVLEHCKTKADFGAVKLLTHVPVDYEHKVKIMPLNSLIAYSIFMLTRFHQYIDTEHCLIVQRDGWVLNPESFDMSWLELDYVAPLFMQYDKIGSGGFSLRSKRLMKNVSENTIEWDGTDKHAHEIQDSQGYYEDGVISLSGRFSHFNFCSLKQGADFAVGGNRNPEYFRERPFGFHRGWEKIDFKTGKVDCTDTNADIQTTYDLQEI